MTASEFGVQGKRADLQIVGSWGAIGSKWNTIHNSSRFGSGFSARVIHMSVMSSDQDIYSVFFYWRKAVVLELDHVVVFPFPIPDSASAQGKLSKRMEKGAKEPQTMIHASFQVKNIILSPSVNSRYRAGTKLRKFGRERRSSRRPKVTILIWKDSYLSHASRRSGMKSFRSTIGPELIFYRDMSG
ncbi:unnamed protein product [Microthlaspi erraticum]|uniref:Uncharacterized protein n=1 Tax=Microthlaspi erraticum TaxID=1685480 RepID=A0A6D2JLY5_9BRAS|nr:unnamed protein product [Microthlaspi erraticum]